MEVAQSIFTMFYISKQDKGCQMSRLQSDAPAGEFWRKGPPKCVASAGKTSYVATCQARYDIK